MNSKSVKISIIILVILVVVVGLAFFGGDGASSTSSEDYSDTLPSSNKDSNQQDETPDDGSEKETEVDSSQFWREYELTDVNSGESFTISELNSKPILLETFAVWCPTCTGQQKEIKELHEEIGEDAISISLNTDSNEDEGLVLEHAQSNGFDWRYAIAPAELSQSLVDEFGLGIVNAPSVPVILICEDGSFRQLDSGIKRVQELKDELATCGS